MFVVFSLCLLVFVIFVLCLFVLLCLCACRLRLWRLVPFFDEGAAPGDSLRRRIHLEECGEVFLLLVHAGQLSLLLLLLVGLFLGPFGISCQHALHNLFLYGLLHLGFVALLCVAGGALVGCWRGGGGLGDFLVGVIAGLDFLLPLGHERRGERRLLLQGGWHRGGGPGRLALVPCQGWQVWGERRSGELIEFLRLCPLVGHLDLAAHQAFFFQQLLQPLLIRISYEVPVEDEEDDVDKKDDGKYHGKPLPERVFRWSSTRVLFNYGSIFRRHAPLLLKLNVLISCFFPSYYVYRFSNYYFFAIRKIYLLAVNDGALQYYSREESTFVADVRQLTVVIVTYFPDTCDCLFVSYRKKVQCISSKIQYAESKIATSLLRFLYILFVMAYHPK